MVKTVKDEICDCWYAIEIWHGEEINIRAVCEDCWETEDYAKA